HWHDAPFVMELSHRIPLICALMKRSIFWLAFAPALAALPAGCSKPEAAGRAGASPAGSRAVRVARAEVRPMERAIAATGSLAALERATLTIKVAGRLQSIAVDLGSVVQQGDVIAQLEPRDYELRVQQAAAALAQARAALGLPIEGANDVVNIEECSSVREARAVLEEATHNRARIMALEKQRIASASDLDSAEATFKVASNRLTKALEEARSRQAALSQRRAELDLARQQLADATLRAPFAGAIETRHASVGEYITVGAPVVTLVRTDLLRLRLEVPERDAIGVRAGQTARFHIEGDTNVYSAALSRLSPSISEQSRMLIVEADVPGGGLVRPGAFVRADIVTNPRDQGVAVPPDALITFAGFEKVIAVGDGKAVEKNVTTGRRGADWVEIVSGVKPGDLVVLNPGNLRTGDPVTVAAP
ncbi:MAG: efflux RND transporter periplasmic adaptor subunit, partial [Verrucomicrobiae bacterium]|nr:efflux RND transporter periplasmic adaptor subunit [Verrucomicrobiae bacterium]